ncbi:nuclear transport factor 2 [Cymbomonas tetramitiformis]|uniref:Nuclear transport factor 2 n=1 Tax=Cymbomonas tetramitiformis TaxID=36881 RepID=A0AAE0L1X4_9CHLO|nr:nuclear transport factor 2 [Cymbomonas tetramitiformis]
MAAPADIAKAFTAHFYQTFDANRPALANLYQEGSMLTFEGTQFGGTAAIMEKLANLPFNQCLHTIVTQDAQPTHAGILVFVSGEIRIEGEEHMMKFSEVFHLMPANGSYYILNDMFRLNLS